MHKLLIGSLLLASSVYISMGVALAAEDTTQLTSEKVKTIVGTVSDDKSYIKKTSAALVGKTFTGTLEVVGEAAKGNPGLTDALTTKKLHKSHVFFNCKDSPEGLPNKMKPLKVSSKIVKFSVEQAGDSDDLGTITLERCKTSDTGQSSK